MRRLFLSGKIVKGRVLGLALAISGCATAPQAMERCRVFFQGEGPKPDSMAQIDSVTCEGRRADHSLAAWLIVRVDSVQVDTTEAR